MAVDLLAYSLQLANFMFKHRFHCGVASGISTAHAQSSDRAL